MLSATLLIVILVVIMQSIVMLNVFMLSVTIRSVIAPLLYSFSMILSHSISRLLFVHGQTSVI